MSIELFFKLASVFEKNGFSLYLVGGSVRDYLLYGSFDDMDLATNATLKEMSSFLNFKTQYKHFESGVIFFENYEIDVTTLRKETKYDDFRHPVAVELVSLPEQDYLRRDFTINSLYIDAKGNVIDFVNGQSDLKNKTIKMIGDPLIRFQEDPLRILRALRFTFNLQFNLDEKIKRAIKIKKSLLKKINYEKISEELNKFHSSKKEIRDFLSLYEINKVIPLNFENNKRLYFNLDEQVILKKTNFISILNNMQNKSYLGQIFKISINNCNGISWFNKIMQKIQKYHILLKENGNFIKECRSYNELNETYKIGKRSAVLCVEIPLLKSEEMFILKELYNVGVRMISISNNMFIKGKISEKGINVINILNNLGIIIDVSNLNELEILEVLRYSNKPICLINVSLNEIKVINQLILKSALICILDEDYKKYDCFSSSLLIRNYSNNNVKNYKRICYLNFFELMKKNEMN